MADTKNIQSIRQKISSEFLNAKTVNPNPLVQFNNWYKSAEKSELDDPSAMTLATATGDGKPSTRTVLLKELNAGGFVFYTNYQSRKGLEIEQNPFVSLNFLWLPLHRQIRIQGVLEKLDPKTSDEYFKTRPRGSQIGAWASPQSQAVASRSLLEERFEQIRKRYEGKEIPRPAQWGGYLVIPTMLEFWQGRENRLHDRIRYDLQKDGGWSVSRLAP